MPYITLISSTELSTHLEVTEWVIVDCRFSLEDRERGQRDYQQAHIPGAIYAHLEEDLSSPVIPGKTGRHPLPEIDVLASRFSSWGIDSNVQVVAYDDGPGSMAARLWWLLRWLGHSAVAVLDGGWAHWVAQSGPARSGLESRRPCAFIPRPRPELVAEVSDVLALLNSRDFRLIDCRAVERYRGEHEPIDPVAGHIPGAICAPYLDNVGQDGLFLPPQQLRARFETLLGEIPPERVVFYCGSGVTAAHNLLAMLHSGLGDARLYAGSWSEWITDPERPIERG